MEFIRKNVTPLEMFPVTSKNDFLLRKVDLKQQQKNNIFSKKFSFFRVD
jgi:hypothetical protein